MSDDTAPFPAIHRRALVIDGHSDVPLDVVKRRQAGERHVLYTHHLPAWQQGGVNAAILTVAGDEMALQGQTFFDYTLSAIESLQEDVQERPDQLAIVTSAAALLRQVRAGRFAIILNVEGGRPLAGSVENLYRLHDAGVRFMTLTWNERNELGAGAGCRDDDTGLTPFGRRVLHTMARLGMVADLSHASPRTFWDAVALQTGNLVLTHSNAAALQPHARNVDDRQIRAIADQGGYVGVCFYPGFLHHEDPTVTHVVDHVTHIAAVAGVDHVAIGPDYIDYALEEIVAHITNSSVDYGHNFTYPRGLETVRSLGNLTAEMARRGLDEEAIAAVLGGNVTRVFQRVCGQETDNL